MKRQSIYFIIILCITFIIQSCHSSDKPKEDAAAKPVMLSASGNKSSCVFLTNDQNNKPVVSWIETDSAGEKHFFFSRMDTKEDRFLKPMAIPIEQNVNIHEEGMPKIAIKGDGTLLAIYETSTPVKGSRWGLGDIRYVQSFDNGKHWTAPESVSPDVKKGLSASFADLARLGNGEIAVSWLGTNPDKTMARPVFFSKTNGKEGFGKEVLITRTACQCCRTALSSDKKGEVSIAFRDILSGEIRDISVSTSEDYGDTFSKPVSFSDDDWVVDGCPHNGPSVASYNHHTYVTWFTGGNNSGVYYAELDSSRRVVAKKYINPEGRFIQLGLMPNGTRIAAYNASYKKGDSIFSRIMVNKIDEQGFFTEEITPPGADASYPVVQYAGNKNVVIAWTDNKKIYYKLVNTEDIIQPVLESVPTHFKLKNSIPIAELNSDIDPVCGMTLVQSTIGDTTLYHNKIVGFCSDHCKHQFMEHPAHFLN